MKKINILVLVMILIMTGCSSEGDGDNVVYNDLSIENYELYDGENFRMQYPIGWEIIDGAEIQNRYKSNAEVVMISDNIDAFFTPNIIVERLSVDAQDTLEEVYADVWETNTRSLLIAEEIGRNRFTTIANGQSVNGLVVEFTAKRKLEGDVLTYLQALIVDNEEAVLATAAFDELDSENQSAEILEALKTLAIK